MGYVAACFALFVAGMLAQAVTDRGWRSYDWWAVLSIVSCSVAALLL